MLVRHVPRLGNSRQGLDKLPEAFIKEVAENTNLSDLIGQFVKLKKSGASYLGLCPFHGEKSPSFTVSEQKHFYHCFGCGKHGDAIRFLTDYAGMTFREAVTELAERQGRPLPTSTGPTIQSAPLGPLYDRLTLAYSFFRHCLKHTDKPKEYLKSRGVTPESLQRFAIGYAPEGWQSLQEAFPAYQSDDLLVQAGLVKDKDGRRYDAFRDRLIFSIKDPRGRIVGFGGRAFDDNSPPKYLNSPESPVFDKGSVLFGVHEARSAIQASKQAIVVEGYMDVVMLAQHGVENVVASMGTACTPRQIERLCAVAPETVFTFDGDAAGLQAAWRALSNCLPFATDTHTFRFCLLDSGMDPDDIVRKEGREAFLQRIDAALPLSSFMLTQLAGRFNNLETPEDRARFLTAGTDLIRLLPFGSNLYKTLRDALARSARVGVDELVSLSKQQTRRHLGKEDAFWANLTDAVVRWPELAAQKAEAVVSSLSADDYAALSEERFSGEAEKAFWEAFLSLHDIDPTAQPAATRLGAVEDAQLHKDLVENIVVTISRHKDRARRTAISEKYRQGLMSEAEFIEARQRA